MAESSASAVPGSPAEPAIEFAEWLPALGGSRLLRVHGHAPPADPPALVLDTPGGEQRIEPRAQPRFTRAHEWRASFLIPAELVRTGWTATTLEWPNGTRLPLPDPPADARAEVIAPSVLETLRTRRFTPTPDLASPPDLETPPAPASAAPDLETPPAVAARSSPDESAAPAPPEAVTRPPDGAMSPSPRAAAGRAGSWTALPEAFSGSVFEAQAVWTARRAELERELNRAAEAIARAQAGEREARESVLAALSGARAELRAVRAARAADQSTIASLTAALEAESIAHAVARRTIADVRLELARARAEREAAGLRSALEAERTARADAEEARAAAEREGSVLMERVAELSRRVHDDADLERHAREQAETAATAARRPEQETGELVANLDAAAAALRASAVPPADEPPPAGGAAAPEAVPPADAPEGLVAAEAKVRQLREVLVELAREDSRAAGEILVGLLPAQGVVIAGELAYDLTVRGIGTFAVDVAGGEARVARITAPRWRREARFHLSADPLTLAELLAGEDRRIRRFIGRARVSRRKRRLRPLRALPAASVSLADAVRAGARLEPELVYRALPLAIAPEWTAGCAFTVAQEISGDAGGTWYLAVGDGTGLAVSRDAPAGPPHATVTMTRAAFDRLLRDEPPLPDERPLVHGDRAAVALLKTWTDRARGG
jgi:hypothetical protein